MHARLNRTDLQACAQLVCPALPGRQITAMFRVAKRATLSAFGFAAGPTAERGSPEWGYAFVSDCRAGGIIFRFDCDDYVKFFRRIV